PSCFIMAAWLPWAAQALSMISPLYRCVWGGTPYSMVAAPSRQKVESNLFVICGGSLDFASAVRWSARRSDIAFIGCPVFHRRSLGALGSAQKRTRRHAGVAPFAPRAKQARMVADNPPQAGRPAPGKEKGAAPAGWGSRGSSVAASTLAERAARAVPAG